MTVTAEIRDLQHELRNLWTEQKSLNDKSLAEKRDFSPEEQSAYDRRNTRMDEIETILQRAEDQSQRGERLSAVPDPEQTPRPQPQQADIDIPPNEDIARRAYLRYLRMGDRAIPQFTKEERAQMRVAEYGENGSEVRALQMDSDVAGGYLVAPQQFVNQLIEAIRDSVYIRAAATNIQLDSAHSLGVPKLTTRPEDSTWSGEIVTVDEDTALDFGKRELFPHLSSKRLKVSMKLARTAPNVDMVVRDQLAYKFGITEEKAFLTGSGAQQPLGVFTASADGISTSRDVSTANSTTEIAAHNLIEVKYSLKEGYWGRAVWIMHRDLLKETRKLTDGNGQYLWQPGIAGDRPATILDQPYRISEYAPNTLTTGQYVYILGDFRQYWIATALNFTIQVVMELYAETNQIGYIGRMEVDGAPALEEAFARGVLA